MVNLKLFEEWQKFDYPRILRILQKTKGWGQGSMSYVEEFENSEYFKNPENNHDYAEQFHIFLVDLQRGETQGWSKSPSLPLGKWKTGPTVMSPTSIYNRRY